MYLDGPAVVIEPDPAAPGGIAVSGVKSLRPAKILSDRFHFSLGDHAIEIDGLRRLRRPDRRPLDLGALSAARGGARTGSLGYSLNPVIDHVHLRRANNYPSHEYFLVYRQLSLGSAVEAGLRLAGTGIEGEHALIIYEGGEAFVTSWDGEVRFRSGDAGGKTPTEGTVLSPGFLYPLVP